MSQGWIKVHRSILEHPRYSKGRWLAVWLYLLLNAAHTPHKKVFKGKTVTIHPGQLVESRESIARALGVNSSLIERILKCLKIEQQISWESGNKSRLITIVNWSAYQKPEKELSEKSNIKRTPGEHQANSHPVVLKNGKKGKNVQKAHPSDDTHPSDDNNTPSGTPAHFGFEEGYLIGETFYSTPKANEKAISNVDILLTAKRAIQYSDGTVKERV